MAEDPGQSLGRAHVLFSIALATCEVKEDVTVSVPCSTAEALEIIESAVEHMGVEHEPATRVRPIYSH